MAPDNDDNGRQAFDAAISRMADEYDVDALELFANVSAQTAALSGAVYAEILSSPQGLHRGDEDRVDALVTELMMAYPIVEYFRRALGMTIDHELIPALGPGIRGAERGASDPYLDERAAILAPFLAMLGFADSWAAALALIFWAYVEPLAQAIPGGVEMYLRLAAIELDDVFGTAS